MASAARRPEGFLRSKSARGSPDRPSALISLSMSYSTRRIESVAPAIKRYDANLPTMICANRLAPAVLFSIGCARLACRNSSVLRSLRGGNERNITKSLADRFWADDAPLGKSPADGPAELPESNVEGLLRWVLCSILMHIVTKSPAFWRWMATANGC